LHAPVDAWQRQRNNTGGQVDWKFTTHDACKKLSRAYPQTINTS
jgi:hypothetical protein